MLGVWPAANPAAEAFAFYALVGQRGEKVLASGALGGWTQTSIDLSKLAKLGFERERRMVTGSCLKCGSTEPGHQQRKCKAVAFAWITCAYCDVQNRISDRGEVRKAERGAVRSMEAVAAVRVVEPRVAEPALAPARAVVSPRVAEPAAHTPARNFLRVRLCRVGYTTLAWYLGKENPTPREVRLALECGRDHAAVMSRSQASTLVATGFAKLGPGLPAELLPSGDGVLPSYPLNTLAKTIKTRVHLQVCAAPASLTGSRHVLFRIADLSKVRW